MYQISIQTFLLYLILKKCFNFTKIWREDFASKFDFLHKNFSEVVNPDIFLTENENSGIGLENSGMNCHWNLLITPISFFENEKKILKFYQPICLNKRASTVEKRKNNFYQKNVKGTGPKTAMTLNGKL